MPNDLPITYSVHDTVPAEDARIVSDGLERANEEAAPFNEVRSLACFARLHSREIIGGAIGRTWGKCCELQQLWVAIEHRRKGVATRLLQEFESSAKRRGCRTCYLDTFSFQAPTLYEAAGYKLTFKIEGYAPGVSKSFMVRDLTM